ncbi:RNA polymerase subunit sigma-70 [Dyella sp. LX-66]|nr:RNA polymerase subunit sigma-70 [Dyella sp. LX-1]MBT2140089.1 RNA polymerase subunit sigma-70 [Dyella sp. LX-66]
MSCASRSFKKPPAKPRPQSLTDDGIDADMAERTLLRRVIAGERAALEALFHRYHGRLCRLLTCFIKRPDVIAEVIQDCFWDIWLNADIFQDDERVSSRIMSLAYHYGVEAFDPIEDTRCNGQSLRRHRNEHDELRNRLGAALDRLTIDQRVVLELVYGMGYALSDVAVIMRCPASAVKMRMLHARIRLGSALT